VIWRDDIDSLAFQPAGHEGFCMVHRLALRTLLGHVPVPAECLAYFAANQARFEEAASRKVAARRLAAGDNFHLTSRDIEGQ